MCAMCTTWMSGWDELLDGLLTGPPPAPADGLCDIRTSVLSVNAILDPHVVGLSRVVREHSAVTARQDTMWTQVERLVADLRRRGVDVSLTEVLDAARALEHVDLARRVELRSMLGATLVKQAHHQSTFAELFDRHFPVRVAPRRPDTTGSPGGRSRR